MNKERKYLFIIAIIALIIIGLSYVVAMGSSFKSQALRDGPLIQLVPEKCKVLDASSGVDASVEFNRDVFGNVSDKTYIKLIANNVYDGASSTYSIVAKNVSSFPLSIDDYMLIVDSSNNTLEDYTYFSGTIRIHKDDGAYHDELGIFEGVRLSELSDTLTALMEYRKIDTEEEVEIELMQYFEGDEDMPTRSYGLSYVLLPRFIQYFPREGELH
ncbi:MAG: hypothetical protein GX974_07920 [Clostridiales bacterium]|nr:hypothetical protein [Clostridiales bacterium]